MRRPDHRHLGKLINDRIRRWTPHNQFRKLAQDTPPLYLHTESLHTTRPHQTSTHTHQHSSPPHHTCKHLTTPHIAPPHIAPPHKSASTLPSHHNFTPNLHTTSPHHTSTHQHTFSPLHTSKHLTSTHRTSTQITSTHRHPQPPPPPLPPHPPPRHTLAVTRLVIPSEARAMRVTGAVTSRTDTRAPELT